MRLVLASLVFGSLFVLGSTAAAVAQQPQIWVAVHGPAGWSPREELVLQVGPTSWGGYGGVVSVSSAGPAQVRLVGRESCHVYADFVAPVGTMWVIRFVPDGSTRIEDWSARGMDSGPALRPAAPAECPPEYAEPDAPASADGGLGGLVTVAVLGGVALVLLVGLLMFLQSRSSNRPR